MSDAIITYKAYLEGNTLLGMTTADLPEISHATTEVKGAGINGTIDMPILGLIQAMSLTLNFRTVTPDAKKLAAPKVHDIQLWTAIQSLDKTTGQYTVGQQRISLKVLPKRTAPGKLEVGATQDRAQEFEVLYYKEELNGEKITEIDKLNEVFMIDGVDYWATIRNTIGM